jgi:hypothetical protein
MSGVYLLAVQKLAEKLRFYITGINSQVPLDHATNMNESYENMKMLLEKIQYEKYNWNICRELKAIVLLLGLQLGHTEFCCFFCESDIKDRKHHYVQKQWPKRESLILGPKNLVSNPLITPEKVYLSFYERPTNALILFKVYSLSYLLLQVSASSMSSSGSLHVPTKLLVPSESLIKFCTIDRAGV